MNVDTLLSFFITTRLYINIYALSSIFLWDFEISDVPFEASEADLRDPRRSLIWKFPTFIPRQALTIPACGLRQSFFVRLKPFFAGILVAFEKKPGKSKSPF